MCSYEGEKYYDINSTGAMPLPIIVLISCSSYYALNNCLLYNMSQLFLLYILSFSLFFYSVIYRLYAFIYKVSAFVTLMTNDLTQVFAGRVLSFFQTELLFMLSPRLFVRYVSLEMRGIWV